MRMTEKKNDDIEVCFREKVADVLVSGKKVGTVSFKSNPYHKKHCYLELEFVSFEGIDAITVFEKLKIRIKKPLQVMVSSEEQKIISFLKKAGFKCKRKCYEIEAQKKDYIGGEKEEKLFVAQAGENIYKRCCDMMLGRYITTHDAINPWTGTKEDFYNNLPDKVFYNVVNGNIKNVAFVEDNEIAYVYGTDKVEFSAFAEVLLTEMFKEHDTITFEADDCDEYAMILKSLFINQLDESFDTYILQDKDSTI